MPDIYLAVRLGSLGDVVLTTGVLDAWQKRSGAKFVFLTKNAFAPVLSGHPAVREIIEVPENALNTRGWINFCRGLALEMGHLELIDLHCSLRTAFLKAVWPTRCHSYPKLALYRRLFRVSGKRFFQKNLLSSDVPARYYRTLYHLPHYSLDLRPRIFLSAGEKQAAGKMLLDICGNTPVLALHPYATHPAKAWPAENWQTLISLLVARQISWVIIGSSHKPLMPHNLRDLTSKTDISRTCALLSRCSALITADSGPMHLAQAVNTPVVAMFGPTTREWGFYPTGKKDTILEKEMPCRPCSLHGRTHGHCAASCMSSIQPEEVLSAIEQIVQN